MWNMSNNFSWSSTKRLKLTKWIVRYHIVYWYYLIVRWVTILSNAIIWIWNNWYSNSLQWLRKNYSWVEKIIVFLELIISANPMYLRTEFEQKRRNQKTQLHSSTLQILLLCVTYWLKQQFIEIKFLCQQ